MRTKTLVVAAATLAAGVLGASAQVYSQNVVGYINLDGKKGFNLVANQLNASPSNTVSVVLPGVPDSTSLQIWNQTSQKFNDPHSYIGGLGWYDDQGNNPDNVLINPGTGFFLQLPYATNVTLVGDVPQGPYNLSLAKGFSLVSIVPPVSQSLTNVDLNFPVADGDSVQFWLPNNVPQKFQDPYSYIGGLGWYDPDGNPIPPQPTVGQSFFLNKGYATNWVSTFTVQQP